MKTKPFLRYEHKVLYGRRNATHTKFKDSDDDEEDVPSRDPKISQAMRDAFEEYERKNRSRTWLENNLQSIFQGGLRRYHDRKGMVLEPFSGRQWKSGSGNALLRNFWIYICRGGRQPTWEPKASPKGPKEEWVVPSRWQRASVCYTPHWSILTGKLMNPETKADLKESVAAHYDG